MAMKATLTVSNMAVPVEDRNMSEDSPSSQEIADQQAIIEVLGQSIPDVQRVMSPQSGKITTPVSISDFKAALCSGSPGNGESPPGEAGSRATRRTMAPSRRDRRGTAPSGVMIGSRGGRTGQPPSPRLFRLFLVSVGRSSTVTSEPSSDGSSLIWN